MSADEYNERAALLEGDALAQLMSPYLLRGLMTEQHIVESIQIDGRKARAKCRLMTEWNSPTAAYHVSFFNAAVMVSQVTMVHGLYLEGYAAKEVEVFLNDFSMTCPRQLTDPSEIWITTDVYARYVTPAGAGRKRSRVYLRTRFEVCDIWFGDRGLCFHLPQSAPQNL